MIARFRRKILAHITLATIYWFGNGSRTTRTVLRATRKWRYG